MTNTNRDELKSTSDSAFPWMATGSKSSTKRDEKAIVRVAGSSVENEDMISLGTTAKESEPGKLQGQHVPERVRRVSMKKRGIMVASPSPRKSFGRRGRKKDSIGYEFSGITLLADTACNLSNDLAPAVNRLPVQEPVVQQQDASTIIAFEGMIAAKEGESENGNLAQPDNGAVPMSGEPIEKKKKSLKEERLHWDLNIPMDAWGPPCDEEDDVSGKGLEGEITESMSPKEAKPIDESKDHLDGLVASDGQEKFSSPSGPKAKAAAGNGNEFQSDYDSQLEDGELKEQYRWGKNEVEDGEIEPKDYGLEPEDEGYYAMSEIDDNKMKDSGKRIMAETKSESNKDLHLKKGSSSSSSSRRFLSRPFKEFPSHAAIPRERSDDYEELRMGPYRSSRRDDRSSERGYFSGRGSRPRYVLESPHPKCMMGGFDQSRSGSGQGSQPNGYVRKRFSNRGYRGRFRMFPNGGDRVFRGRHGYNNQFPGRMHNSQVFRRSRSRSPVPWNIRDRLSPPRDGFSGDERMRFPFQKRFSENQEIGFTSPPRNGMSSPRLFERRRHDSGENHNSFRERKFGVGQRNDVGSSLRRLNSGNRNNYIPFRRHGRFDESDDSTGGNRFEMRQQKTRRDEVKEDGGDDVRRSGFTKESR